MIFSELYSAYYSAVAAILREAVKHPLRKDELRNIIEKKAFGESMLNIEPAIGDERWQIIHSDGTTPLKHVPTMPLTTLEKRWMKAIASDPRIRLFSDELPDFPDVEPLFKPEDISVFDKYSDGDPYEDEKYIKNFRLILQAVKDRRPLYIESANSKDKIINMTLMPEYIEYSEKDDKFRLIGSGRRHGATLNIARIIKCMPYNGPFEAFTEKAEHREPEKVEFELYDRRNALERVLMHFAHFEKQAEKTGEDKYKVTIFYDKNDETEIVIRILSFGPMIKVTAPENFIELIKDRLLRQKSCGH
jgi:hypothetical protein